MNEHDGCKWCKYESEAIESSPCIGCKQNAIDKYIARTNADKIRNMSDEELVEFLCDISGVDCDKCIAAKYCKIGHTGFIDWLQIEVSDGN